jgi:hypothetical protein
MHIAYMDESGIGKLKYDPYVIVAGVLTDGDAKWRAVQNDIRDLIAQTIPEAERPGFVFHAKDLFNGHNSTPKARYSELIRWNRLELLCRIPAKHNLPVIYGIVDRARMVADFGSEMSIQELTVVAQATAALLATVHIERHIKKLNRPDEVCIVVYEQNDHAREFVKASHKVLTNPNVSISDDLRHLLPLDHVVDAAHFAEKQEAIILQLADAVSYAIYKKLGNKPNASRFFDPIIPVLTGTSDALIVKRKLAESAAETESPEASPPI